jgi:hypothetical protein
MPFKYLFVYRAGLLNNAKPTSSKLGHQADHDGLVAQKSSWFDIRFQDNTKPIYQALYMWKISEFENPSKSDI